MGAPTRRRHNARPAAAVAVSDVAIIVIEDVGHSLEGCFSSNFLFSASQAGEVADFLVVTQGDDELRKLKSSQSKQYIQSKGTINYINR